ncbi:MAG: hypothetical protein ABJN69_11930 [Hellea sp.]
MLELKRKARASALAIMTYAFLAGAAPMAFAQENDAASRQFSAKAGEVVLKAQSLITANEFQAALTLLGDAKDIPDLTPYERSIIGQMQGASHYQLDQYGPAISGFERAIAAGGLRPKEIDDMQVQIAQLMIANGQFRQGAERLEAYLNGGGQLKPQYTDMLTQAWVNAEEPARALPWASKWFAAADPKERKHYDLMNFIYAKLEKNERQADLVIEMIERWPAEKELWDAWASLLSQSGQEQDAFEVNKLLYLRGALSEEADIMKVIQYYAYYNMPYQAAQILEKEMNAGRIPREADKLVQLSSLFRQAREYARAIPILEAATKTGGTGDLYAQLGEALYNEGYCERAETAFKRGIDRGYDAGKAWMLIATCRYEDVQRQQKLTCEMTTAEKAAAPKSQARQSTIAAFENVPLTSPQSRDAKKWISFIIAERETFDKRCGFERDRVMKTCYLDIRRAYDAVFLTDEFELNDTNCEQFIPAYDKEYRSKKTG